MYMYIRILVYMYIVHELCSMITLKALTLGLSIYTHMYMYTMYTDLESRHN